MLQVVATEAYYPPLAITGAILLKMEKWEFEKHKN